MTMPMPHPPRKNPILRTRQSTQPPGGRSRVALGLTAAAAIGRFELQQCRDCAAVQYPPREACFKCLSARLLWKQQPAGAQLISETTLHHSNDLFYRERLPWRLGLVQLDAGRFDLLCGQFDVAALVFMVGLAFLFMPGSSRI